MPSLAATKWLCELGELWLGLSKGYDLSHSYGASWLILWLLLAAHWVRLVCNSATTSFTVHLLQAILCTASKRRTVREWLESAVCKSTNHALLRFHMYMYLCKFANHDRNAAVQLLTVATPIVFNAVMPEVRSS